MNRDGHWDLYRSMLAVMRRGSLSAAARDLAATQPTIGRHIETLEGLLGLALFTRSQSGLAPTSAALALAPHAEAMEAAAAALLRAADGAGGDEAGTVRITASEIMGAEVLPELLTPIRERYPRIVFELVLSNRGQDLLRRDADIAIRMFRPEQAALIARRLGSVTIAFYAHRRYLDRKGRPADFDAMREHDVIGFDRDNISARAAVVLPIPVTRELFSVRSDSDLAQFAALRAGLGIGACQVSVARRHPDLERVIPPVSFDLEVWLAMHEDQRNVRPVRLVYDALAAGLGGHLALQKGDPAR